MVQFRPQAREIIAKIVYYGPPLGGKTTNLRTLYKGYPSDTRGELVVVPAGGDRTIFFDFLPLDAGTLRGMKLRVQLYTVPGQVHYNATRQIVLRGVDAVVFVADSQRELLRSNRDSWEDLKNNLLLQGLTLAELPHVLQYNKRDISDILPVEELDAATNEYNAPFFEAVATVGIGVEETLQNVVKLVARSLRDRFKLGGDTPGLPTELVATLPPLDEGRVTTGSSRIPQFSSSGGTVDISGLGASSGDTGVPAEREPAETARVKISPLQPPPPANVAPFTARAAATPLTEPPPRVVPEMLERKAALTDVESPPPPAVLRPPAPAVAPPSPPVPVAPPAVTVIPPPLAVVSPPAPVIAPPPPASMSPFPEQAQDSSDAFAFGLETPLPAPEPLLLDDPFAAPPAAGSERASDDVFAIGVGPAEPPGPLWTPPEAPIEPEEASLEEAIPEEAELAEMPPADAFSAGEQPVSETFPGCAEPASDALFEQAPEIAIEPDAALPPVEAAAIQRAVPRALAQMGEVRELEVEVPVPAVWTGGRRMTLQLRLTLVPQQDGEPADGD